jgi:hypothetical protein
MKIRILLDHDIEGYDVLLAAGLRETGWDQYVDCEFVRLRDLGLPHDFSDQDIWRHCQAECLLLVTHNRNCDDDTSLEATIERENTPQSWPVITIPRVEKLALADYRQQVANRLAEIILYLEDHLGLGRIFIP